jgi:hypothetical protein
MSTRTLALALALALLPVAAPIRAQEMRVDTVFVQVYGAPASVALDGPVAGYVGDTLRWTYSVRDEDGMETPAFVSWSIEQDGGEILEATDSTLAIVPSRPGQLRLIATITRIDSLVIGLVYGPGNNEEEGTFAWGRDGFALNVGGGMQLCGFFYSGVAIVAVGSAPACHDTPPALALGPARVPSIRLALLADPRPRQSVGMADVLGHAWSTAIAVNPWEGAVLL